MYEINITDYGREKLALSTIDVNKIVLSRFIISDQNDDLNLSSVVYSQLINQVNVYQNEIIIQCVIPESVGDVWLRYIAIFDDENGMIACGNLAEFYKPNFDVSPSICEYQVKLNYAHSDQLRIEFESEAYASKKDHYQSSEALIKLMDHHLKHIWPLID
ncbi:phage tail protein [Thiotrichales bacterium 19S3-7]|nr:phage tail protein [Thiotrichales bacterium 19S3-7]MCF6801280.1 phage tail protein [Thiotrichales bacterium 19S3-11]